jgi:hypothetical protein
MDCDKKEEARSNEPENEHKTAIQHFVQNQLQLQVRELFLTFTYAHNLKEALPSDSSKDR